MYNKKVIIYLLIHIYWDGGGTVMGLMVVSFWVGFNIINFCNNKFIRSLGEFLLHSRVSVDSLWVRFNFFIFLIINY